MLTQIIETIIEVCMQKDAVTITCIKSDAKGDSYFEDISIPLKSVQIVANTPQLFVSPPRAAQHLFAINPSHWEGKMHVAPHRQYVIVLSGCLEITISKGEARQFRAGNIVLAEDVTGKGHKTVTVGDEPVLSSVVQI
jgi:quercetin dioxygenase-like cupin family protein